MQAQVKEMIHRAIQACLPDEAVTRALSGRSLGRGNCYLVAIGKAAWQMAHCAATILGDRLTIGVVVTKHDHSKGEIPGCQVFEGGHPVLDEFGIYGSRVALAITTNLKPEDQVIFLVSGGGSALFEDPKIPLEELSDITQQLLASGADIVEMNIIRKRLSKVKGGRFAQHCAPAKVFSIVLSDVLGDPLDMIASGPAFADSSTCDQAVEIAKKYQLNLSDQAWQCLNQETPKVLDGVESQITGSVIALCQAVMDCCEEQGYQTTLLTDQLNCEARDAGAFLAAIARTHCQAGQKMAFIAGGETVVHLTGKGKGGRNQELALSAATGIAGLENVTVFSLGSDGTDGPTDAAGGVVDGSTYQKLKDKGIDIHKVLQENDAYHALKAVDGLIITGPTGTNVNDVSVLLIG